MNLKEVDSRTIALIPEEAGQEAIEIAIIEENKSINLTVGDNTTLIHDTEIESFIGRLELAYSYLINRQKADQRLEEFLTIPF
jgi:hypothetical protein